MKDVFVQKEFYIGLISFLKAYWFKKDRTGFNYSEGKDKFYNKENILKKMFLTNDIVSYKENIHKTIESGQTTFDQTRNNF